MAKDVTNKNSRCNEDRMRLRTGFIPESDEILPSNVAHIYTWIHIYICLFRSESICICIWM